MASQTDSLTTSITELAQIVEETVANLKENQIHYKSTGDFATDKDGLRRIFLFTQYSDCFKVCGVETRQQLSDKIQKYKSDHQLQTAYDLLVTAEQMHAQFVEEINNKLMLGNPLISNITKLNGIIPDIKLINGNNGDTVELYSLLKTSQYTLLVLIRHYG